MKSATPSEKYVYDTVSEYYDGAPVVAVETSHIVSVDEVTLYVIEGKNDEKGDQQLMLSSRAALPSKGTRSIYDPKNVTTNIGLRIKNTPSLCQLLVQLHLYLFQFVA
jgi:arginine/ornithine N-succinyltransferase beta subunit